MKTHADYPAAKSGEIASARRSLKRPSTTKPDITAGPSCVVRGRGRTRTGLPACRRLRRPGRDDRQLKGFIEAGGGTAIGCTTLTGKPWSAKLTPSAETLRMLRAKHGGELESWWQDTFGYGFDFLTESEARYLARADSVELIRNRILAARQAHDD